MERLFTMMIGLPASGKSTYVECHKKDAMVISTDAIRAAFNVVNPFELVREIMMESMKSGTDIIYDATNMSTKNRREWLEMAKRFKYRTRAVVMLTPIDECIERNKRREARVPSGVIEKFIRKFQYPYEGEFDEIVVIQDETKELDIPDIDQENTHHSFSLNGHMSKAAEIMKGLTDDPDMVKAAGFHDIGKPYTKSHYTSKGELTESAHYYGHENAGAYLWLTSRKYDSETERIGRLINYHMRGYVWETSENAKEKDEKMFSKKFVDELTLMHEADVKAH